MRPLSRLVAARADDPACARLEIRRRTCSLPRAPLGGARCRIDGAKAMADKADVVLIRGAEETHRRWVARAVQSACGAERQRRRGDRSGRRSEGACRRGHRCAGRAHERRDDGAFPQARDRVELRRRLRQHRREVCDRAQNRRLQYTGCADRGGRRHRARAFALHGPRIPASRTVLARREVDAGAVSAEQDDAARPHRRTRGPRPNRQGDRAASRRLQCAGGVPQPQSARRRTLQVLSRS